MPAINGDDAVYAAILARVERPELTDQCRNVLQKECKTIKRRLHQVSPSLTALKQLQAAANYLRPTGDWVPVSLHTQLKSIEELQKRLETAIENLTSDKSTAGETRKKSKKRRRQSVESDKNPSRERQVVVIDISESEEEDIEDTPIELVAPHVSDDEVAVETEIEDCSVEQSGDTIQDTEPPIEAEAVESRQEEVDTISVKQEMAVVVQVEMSSDSEELDLGVDDESPMELDVLESSDEEAAVELEVPDSEESALELDVLESESDEDFPSCLEVATRLRKAGDDTQLKEFPAIVEQLRSYLQNKKHLTVAELDGLLFAHKNITITEVEEVGRSMESMIIVGMRLPLRPQIKSALTNLFATVKQFELTLGELPGFLRPTFKQFSDYLSLTDKDVTSASHNFFSVVEV